MESSTTDFPQFQFEPKHDRIAKLIFSGCTAIYCINLTLHKIILSKYLKKPTSSSLTKTTLSKISLVVHLTACLNQFVIIPGQVVSFYVTDNGTVTTLLQQPIYIQGLYVLLHTVQMICSGGLMILTSFAAIYRYNRIMAISKDSNVYRNGARVKKALFILYVLSMLTWTIVCIVFYMQQVVSLSLSAVLVPYVVYVAVMVGLVVTATTTDILTTTKMTIFVLGNKQYSIVSKTRIGLALFLCFVIVLELTAIVLTFILFDTQIGSSVISLHSVFSLRFLSFLIKIIKGGNSKGKKSPRRPIVTELSSVNHHTDKAGQYEVGDGSFAISDKELVSRNL